MPEISNKFQINGKLVEFLKEKKLLKKDEFSEDSALASIFNKLNKADENGKTDDILDENETKEFEEKLMEAAGDDKNLSVAEAKSLLKGLGLEGIDPKKLFNFIQTMTVPEKNSAEQNPLQGAPSEESPQTEEKKDLITYAKNGETFKQTAERLGFKTGTPEYEEFLNANAQASKRKWFIVGEDVIIPKSLLDKVNQEEVLNEEQGKAEIEKYNQIVEEENRQIQEELDSRKGISFTNKDYTTYEELAGALFRREGIENPSKRQMEARIEDLKKTNPDLKDGELKGKRVTANVSEGMHERISGKEESAKEYQKSVADRKASEGIAKEFYDIADNNAGMNSMKKMQELLDTKVTKDNILDVLDAYDKYKEGDSSIIDTVTSEIGAGGTKAQKKVLTTILDKLCEAAEAEGVSAEDIKHAREEFLSSMEKEMNAAFRRTNPKDMEKAVDFLRGAIVAKQTGGEEITDEEAIAAFNEDFASTDAEAQKTYKDAREAEGWTAKAGDTVLGWFGCTTIEDMDKKLGDNADAVKRLAAAADNPEEFKAAYKEVFGVEFDKNKISARDTALGNYQQAQNLSSTVNITTEILKGAENKDYGTLRTEIKEKFQLDDETIDNVITSYAETIGKEAETDAEKRTMLMRFLESTQENSRAEYQNLTKGKTLEQMGKDLDLLTKSAFGTKDIVKDVVQFNENQQTTEMVTEAAFEIAGTVALQFVPGLGQMAAARLAVSAAKWGTKAVKVANYAAKAEKAFAAAKNLQNMNKATQIGTQMLNAGAATMAVDLSNGKSVREATEKALMNMSFAGVGASSSILAPKLMQTFGITNRALANEIAEEIMNAAGTYGVTKITGGEYGSEDAFIDFASGLIMSRISHVKGGTAADAPVEHGSVKVTHSKTEHPQGTTPKPQEVQEQGGGQNPAPSGNAGETPAAGQQPVQTPKYTKEFEPVKEETPVSSEIIDERLGGNNPELDELNREYASGNSLLQKQAEVEEAITGFGIENNTPEYIESLRAKIKEVSNGDTELEKAYTELLDDAVKEADIEAANLKRENAYIDRTHRQNGNIKSAEESAGVFEEHIEAENVKKENEYIERTHQNPSGKSAKESAEVFEKHFDIKDKVDAVDRQLHTATPLDGDELFERLTHSDNPELKQLGEQYKALEQKEAEIKEQIERVKQLKKQQQSGISAEKLDNARHNPELEMMNLKYKSLELQEQQIKEQVEKLKEQIRQKDPISAEIIDKRLKPTDGDYADLKSQLQEEEAVGLENEYIERTHGNPSGKSAEESAEVFEQQLPIKERIEAVDKQLHQKREITADNIDAQFLADNPELKALHDHYTALEEQEAQIKKQVMELKEQISANRKNKPEISADIIDENFPTHNPELDPLNSELRALELKEDEIKRQVADLKYKMQKKIEVTAEDIDAGLNQRTGDYEDLASDLKEQEAVGLENEFIRRTHEAPSGKSVRESAAVFEEHFDNLITPAQAKEITSDENLIKLATEKDGNINKCALELAVQYKKLTECDNHEVEFILGQCNGNYKKVNDLMDKIQSELDRMDLEIRNGGFIGIKGLKAGEYPDMSNEQFKKKYGSALNKGNKLINHCYRINDLMHFYLFGKGKYIESFNSGNIIKDCDIAYGCRSVTDGYHVRYTKNIREKEDEIAALMAHSLSSTPTPDQDRALGYYKGDMSDLIQERRMIKEGNDIEEYLSNNPLKRSIEVKREDSYQILSNLKFADGVTLKDALTNPQYHDRLSQIKSLEGQSFINDRFMSTTVGDGAFGNCPVNWDLEVCEGVGATYLDILGLASEGELLLNRGLKVTIIEINDAKPNGIVNIKATVEPATP